MNTEHVNHPDHYNIPGKRECIVAMREDYGDHLTAAFCLMNAYKYLYRAGSKEGNPFSQDYKKAEWYFNYASDLNIEKQGDVNLLELNSYVKRKLEELDPESETQSVDVGYDHLVRLCDDEDPVEFSIDDSAVSLEGPVWQLTVSDENVYFVREGKWLELDEELGEFIPDWSLTWFYKDINNPEDYTYFEQDDLLTAVHNFLNSKKRGDYK